MALALLFSIIGYLSGSVLYARIFGRIFKGKDIVSESKDHNPGTANAFMKGGFWCGIFTLFGDLLKGIVPVVAYLYLANAELIKLTGFADLLNASKHTFPLGVIFVMIAPILGHVFPVFFRFKGGKGIAVTFGSLLGLFPYMTPALILAFYFISFSLIIRITPHYSRTIWVYIVAFVTMILMGVPLSICVGFGAIVALVLWRMHVSDEVRERQKVRLLWMH